MMNLDALLDGPTVEDALTADIVARETALLADVPSALTMQPPAPEHGLATLVPVLEHDRAALLHGDSALIGTVLAPNSIDSLVTDPPAGIDFMGKGWDSDKGGRDNWITWLRDIVRPAYDALKPGACGLVWALPRTSHWTATAFEDAGFEIRDIVMHLFGTGMPASLTSASAPIPEWSGSALKPACEHWILVRKPLDGTYGENFATYGTGVLNIDGTRVNDRWPSHVVLSHSPDCVCDEDVDDVQYFETRCAEDCPILMLDEQSGTLASGAKAERDKANGKNNVYGVGRGGKSGSKASKGGASRFYYIAKGSRAEKDEGLDHLPMKTGGEATGRKDNSKGTQNPRAGAGRTGGARNHHPTVKSVGLMRWLVRLVTPPGGTVLDLFAGSGTTGVAALAEDCSFIGVELTAEYLPIIEGRLRHALNKLGTKAPTHAS